MNIDIEQLHLSELIAYLRIQADDVFPELKDENRLTMLAEKWNKNAEICTCRNNEGRLVGMIAFYANQPEKGITYIPHVYVSKNYRGKGIFTDLILKVKEHVKAKGFSLIRLEVQNNNIRAQKAYLNAGFRFLYQDICRESSRYMQLSI